MSDITVNNFKAFYEQIRPYLGAVHSGFTPIGTVISVMGTTAPLNYLACDGTVYNISDYPELAAYFNAQFGSSNFFGGNGTTTFAVPDLRGEFLRGTGTNSHANQGSGANVGVHQDGTQIPFAHGSVNNYVITANESELNNYDRYESIGHPRRYLSSTNSDNGGGAFVPRPTNTSVLYCMASKNIFMDAGSNYSTEEQVVGTWIDGSYVYQRVCNLSSSISVQPGSWVNILDTSTFNINELIKCICYDTSAGKGEINAFSTYIKPDGSYLQAYTPLALNVNRILIQYTKTS